jgi:nicotinamide-nucleotide amidase
MMASEDGMSGARKSAACLAVGSELLGEQRLDSNSLAITHTLARYGVTVEEKRVVGDSVGRLAAAIRELFDRHDVVVITGGLGPTADDITRDAVAAGFDRKIEASAEVEGWIRARYAELGRQMPDICLTMARVVEGSTPLRNNRGSAPGLIIEDDDRLLAVFPGVPWEMEEMLERDLEPRVAQMCPGVRKVSRTLLLGGVVESDTEEKIQHLYQDFGRENITILASYGVLRLVLSAEGEESAAEKQLDKMEIAFRQVLIDDVAAVDAGGLPEVVLESLRLNRQTLAVAESCTGGLMAAHLTDVPGASDVFLGGVVSYSNEAKEQMIDVPHDMLVEHGAVSEEVGRAMAEGVRERFGADWGAGITGIAGPTGGTEEKPVGLVHWAVAGPDGVSAKHRVFLGDRSIVREWSLNATLDLLRRRLLALER